MVQSTERIAQLMHAIEGSPRSAALWVELAELLAGIGELEQALFAVRNALALQPGESVGSELRDRLEQRLQDALAEGVPADLDPWEAVERYGPGPGRQRPVFTDHLAWAVPSREAIRTIVEVAAGRTVLEIGAGRGLWSRLVEDAGGKVIATDARPPKRCWTRVRRQTARQARRRSRAEVLLLCWPPPGAPVGAQALDGFDGTVIHVGEEGEHRVTGDAGLFEILYRDFACTRRVEIPVWPGFADALTVWESR